MAPTVTQQLAALNIANAKTNFYDTDSLDDRRPASEEPLAESWADIEDDDEPLVGKPSGAGTGAAAALQGRPVSNELSRGLLLLEMCKPPDACKPPEACKPPAQTAAPSWQGCTLPAGAQARTPLAAVAAARTPLSSKSRPFAPQPFAPGFYPAAAPACQWQGAAPFGVATEPVGDWFKAEAKTEDEEWTTVMLCGFPRSYDRDKLVNLLDSHGYSGMFDFVYLPMEFEYSECVGYAFVNLTTAAAALRLKAAFEGFAGHPFAGDKPCRTNWSRVQGLGANVKQYRNSPIMHKLVPDEFKPMLFWNGQPQPFPEPTTALKQLRPHRKKEKAGVA